MCPDSLNWTLWVRFHGRNWYQSFIDGSTVWGVDRTDPWGLEMDHPPLGRSYLVIVPSYDMSCAPILLTGLYGWDSMVDIDINPSAIGPQLSSSSAVVWYIMCPDSLNWTLWDSMVNIDINPSSMGPIFGVWIGPTLGVPKWAIRHWAAAIW